MQQGISPPPTKRRRLNQLDFVAANEDDGGKSEDASQETQRSTMRVYSWNVNGITPFLQRPITSFFKASKPAVITDTQDVGRSTASLRAFLRRHSWPEILCLQEVKIASNDKGTQAAVRRAVNARGNLLDDGPEYECYFTLPRDKYNARGWGGKVYGVCSVIRSDFFASHVERVREVEWDLEGRINVVELKEKLAVWNIYAVNGTENPYRDPKSGIVCGTRHDWKIQVHRLLSDECRSMEAKGWQHIIIGDLNVAPARVDGFPRLRTFPEQHNLNRADFHERFLSSTEGFRGVDVWRHLRGMERKYTYHPRGIPWGSSCDRVDLAITSKQLVSEGRVLVTEIFDSAQERGPSDHVPLMVEILLEQRILV